MFLAVCAWLATVNLATFATFAIDKRAAIRGQWRVRESTLLALVTVGGAFGAVLAQTTLRHKTRKEPFRTQLYLIIGMELVLLGVLSLPPVRQSITGFIAQAADDPAYEPAYESTPPDGFDQQFSEF